MVGKYYRIGIFASRDIIKDEELTFDYNAERYGSEAQECFCGESNCRGIIGGTKETVDALLYSLLNVANLEEPINGPESVLEFIGLMLKSVEKYPAMVPGLLHRLELTTDRSTIYRFMKLHGSIMLKTYLYEHQKNDDIISKTLNVIEKIPYKYKNVRVENSHLKEWVSRFVNRTDEIGERCSKLVEKWNALPVYIKPPKYSDLGLEPPEVRRQKEEEQKKRKEEEKKKREEELKQKYNTDTKKYDSTHDYYCRYTESNYAFQNLSQFTYWLNQFHDVVYKRPPPPIFLTPDMKRKKSRNSYNLANKSLRYDYNNFGRSDDYNGVSNDYKGKGRNDDYIRRSSSGSDYKGKSRSDEYNGRGSSPSASSLKFKNERPSRYYHPYRRSSPQPEVSASTPVSSSASSTTKKKQVKEEKKEEVPPLAPNWSEAIDEYGRIYYYNKYTNKTQWERPVVVNDRKTYDGFSEAEIHATIERAEYYSKEASKKREKELAAERENRYKHCMDLDTFKKYAKELSDLVQRKEVRQSELSTGSTYQIDDTLRSRIKKCSVEFMEKLIVKIRSDLQNELVLNLIKQSSPIIN
ncbi:2528_t:CDS:10 [Entrophospora sp. SA101]|nr:5549_t:CDS:10 [Entrophospora sp. SA101]CAJ0825639.1 2528_t:CDS:10 [Entrophospora sp. SA101]